MNRKLKKWVVRPLLIFLISVIALFCVAILLVTLEQEKLVNLAVTELNSQYKGELTVPESSISVFRHFPYVSIGLHHPAFFADKTRSGKPLYEFERLYFGFSLPDIFRGKYNVRKISIHGGHLTATRGINGSVDLLEAVEFPSDTLKNTDHSTNGTSKLEVRLQKVIFKDLDISFIDQASGRTYHSHIDDLSSSFEMDNGHMTMAVNSSMKLNLIGMSDTSFFRQKKFEVDIKAGYNENTRIFKIQTGNFKLQDASFNIEGAAGVGEISTVDFKIKGDKPDFNLIAAFLPASLKETLKPFKYDGRIFFNGIVKGNFSKEHLPLVEVSFGCEDAWFLNTGAGKKIDQLAFKGFYTNGEGHSLQTSELHITNVNARPDKGVFKGNFIIRDFTKPHMLVQINSELELRFLGEFLGIADLQQITGKIKLEMDFKELHNIQLPEQSLNHLKEGIQSKLSISGLTFKIPGYPLAVRDMSLRAEMKDGRVTLDSCFLRIGDSDFYLDGSLSDVHAFLRDKEKVVTLTLNAKSNRIVLSQLVSNDTALSRKMKEEIRRFNVGLMLQTSVAQLLHPSPLPIGNFEIKNLEAAFKNYPHVLKDISATVLINDTTLRLRHLTGMIDKSDILFSGRVLNYQLWFENFKVGKTQIAFDFKSKRFALEDVVSPETRKYFPRGYRKEEVNDVWLRAKADLRYDTVFKFAKADIVNITGSMKRHDFRLKDIKGRIRYGNNKVLMLDSLRGNVGRSDFNISLRLFAGPDRNMKKRTNFFRLNSDFIDADEISNYNFAPPPPRTKPGDPPAVKPDSSQHANSFNIFMIPFSDFTVRMDVGKLKYNKLWLRNIDMRLKMQEDHTISLDTLGMNVADGTVGMKGFLNGTDPEKIYFKSTIDLDQVDLEKMLIKLDHLGEDIVINKNVKGRLSGQIKSEVQVHPNFVPIMSKTKADLKVTVYNGTLVDFAPMQAMAGYFKDKNLRLIRFDTLQNDFSFSNGVLDIPSMDINSSLGFIKMSGKQSLDMNMEYYVQVPVKMVTKVGFNSLFDRKPEEVDIDQVDEIEYRDKEKKIRFMHLKIIGKPDAFKVGLGKDKRSN